MSKFEQTNQNFCITKEIDDYLKEQGFELEEHGTTIREKGWERVYSNKGFVTFVTVYPDRVYFFREDDVEAFLWEEDFPFKEDTTEGIQQFKKFMDEIYEIHL